MTNRFLSGILIFLLIPIFTFSSDKSKKVYELIYEDVQHLKQQILQIEKDIGQNREDIEIIKNQLNELLALNKLFQTEQARLKEDQKKLPTQYQILLEKLVTLNSLFLTLTEKLEGIKKSPYQPEVEQEKEKKAASEQVPLAEKQEKEKAVKKEEQGTRQETLITPNLSPQEVYNMAYSDYLKGNFQLAIDGFKIYLEQFPESPVVDNALYWIGECYFSQKKYKEAIEQFNELILSYPDGDKTPAAYLKKGLSLMELGKKEEALSVFKLLISKYPFEEETKIAQQKIKELGK